jgi:hypothetical protein
MKVHHKNFGLLVAIILNVYLLACNPTKQTTQPPSVNFNDDFIASISQVWVDTLNEKRKLVLANIEGSNMFIGTDTRYGDIGILNLNGITKGFALQWTVMINIQPKEFAKRYISYKGTLTDTTTSRKRMVAMSAIDTLYLKALPPPPEKK